MRVLHFRTSEGVAYFELVRVRIFRAKFIINKQKGKKEIRSLEGARHSTQVSAPVLERLGTNYILKEARSVSCCPKNLVGRT